MEMFELRYFAAVARFENVARAAEAIHVSPAALSKAVSRLEEELQTPLFFKNGRGIRLTPEGQLLKTRAARILQLEEDARAELLGRERGQVTVSVSAEEILHSAFGIAIARKLEILMPKARMKLLIRPESAAVEQVADGEAHLALITREPPSGLASKVLAKVKFQTCASARHPLAKKYSGRHAIPVEEVLEHPFVSPEQALLGRIAKASSLDGWRDDKFPRLIKYRAGGLKLMENLIQEGSALGYLPDYFVKASGLLPLRISGCPHVCQQTVRVVAKEPTALGWLDRLWEKL